MAVPRYIQNFSRRRAILVSDDPRVGAALSPILSRLGLTICQKATAEGPIELSPADLDPGLDVILVDGDLPRMPVVPRSGSGDAGPFVPVVGLVGVEAPSRLKTLLQLGATAFLAKPIHAGSVYSALYLAVNEHARKAELSSALDDHEQRRRQRRFVIKAVLKVMQERSCDDDAAFVHLRNQSMHARVSIEQYCQYVVQRSATRNESDPEPDMRLRLAE
ncbi:ANTAR domain-containing protein [Aurantimonas sp. 22II-16-19i]|uniref:ANTAR domain-containing response regulator n=1 Tax=Aurantimonas sp. 22II-16-19i TaxID=1317114 RepID=UPI0009F7B92C|nr:ANTAR domain-containing protein [Aurantimonas sp. 22II-16-19i]ORE95167.1 antitermination protein [Aurantimonas sp. 22II-16-19i]